MLKIKKKIQKKSNYYNQPLLFLGNNTCYNKTVICMNICRWLGFRLELLGNFVVLAAAIFAVLARGSIQGGIVGLSISYALQVKSFSNECFLTVTALLLLIILIR